MRGNVHFYVLREHNQDNRLNLDDLTLKSLVPGQRALAQQGA